jgi:hypothetical protein
MSAVNHPRRNQAGRFAFQLDRLSHLGQRCSWRFGLQQRAPVFGTGPFRTYAQREDRTPFLFPIVNHRDALPAPMACAGEQSEWMGPTPSGNRSRGCAGAHVGELQRGERTQRG